MKTLYFYIPQFIEHIVIYKAKKTTPNGFYEDRPFGIVRTYTTPSILYFNLFDHNDGIRSDELFFRILGYLEDKVNSFRPIASLKWLDAGVLPCYFERLVH